MSPVQRRFWLAAAGLSALSAGTWWRAKSEEASPEVAEGLQLLWPQAFAGIEGKLLTMQSLRGRPLLLNFWATWCAPCVAEMPELDRLAREWHSSGANVLGIAIDQEDAVRRFLATTPVSFPVVLGGSEGLALARSLGNAAGGLPFSLLISSEGRVLDRKLGASSREDLQAWSQKALAT
jgi:thiol-disulfide isomerase/thioredoxin